MHQSLHDCGFKHEYDQGDRIWRRIFGEQCCGCHLYDRGERSNFFAFRGNVLFGADGDDFGHYDWSDHLLHDEWNVSVDFVEFLFEPLLSCGCGHDYHSGDGGGERNFAEQHFGCGVYDCCEYSYIFAGFRDVRFGLTGDDYRDDGRGDDLLHDEWNVSFDLVDFVLESLHVYGFGDLDDSSHGDRKRDLTERGSRGNLHNQRALGDFRSLLGPRPWRGLFFGPWGGTPPYPPGLLESRLYEAISPKYSKSRLYK
jgi:hypothetical protein